MVAKKNVRVATDNTSSETIGTGQIRTWITTIYCGPSVDTFLPRSVKGSGLLMGTFTRKCLIGLHPLRPRSWCIIILIGG